MVGQTNSSHTAGSTADLKRGAQPDGVRSRHVAELVTLIEGEVIPRLMIAHRDEPQDVPLVTRTEPSIDDVTDFTWCILREDDTAVLCHVESLVARGVTLDRVFLDLLGPTARRLGELWDEDLCTFTEVTIGLLRLQHVLRHYAPHFTQRGGDADPARRVLLTALPDEQHTLGVFMLAEFFRRDGWFVRDELQPSLSGMMNAVSDQWFALVGMSLSSERRVGELAKVIESMRERSVNPDIGIMVGGCIFTERPELVEFVGADLGAVDADKAVAAAGELFGQLRVRHT